MDVNISTTWIPTDVQGPGVLVHYGVQVHEVQSPAYAVSAILPQT
jgi:hypothetical protein